MFLKNVLKQASNSFNTKFGTQSKQWKGSQQASQILAGFLYLIASILE